LVCGHEIGIDKSMDIDKDYYAILGVLPSAEDIVIRAAVDANDKATETRLLQDEIYQRALELRVDKVTAFQRYSARK
jgi:hypothetical protein